VRADHRSAATQAGCLSAIRGFAQYLSGIEITTEIPPTGLIRRGHRPQPYIYSDDEIARILDAARRHPLIRRYALKPHTLYCLFGLLSVTGMRLTEALNLKPEDIDWQQGVLTIGRAKFQKSRLVPLHESTLRQLRAYKKRRDRFFAQQPWIRPVNRIFVSTHGGPLTSHRAGRNFRTLTRRIGMRQAGAGRPQAAHPRSAASVRRIDAIAVVSEREKRRAVTAGALDIPGARLHHRDVLVSDLHTRANGSCGKAAGEPVERSKPCTRLILPL
jgi:integrase